MNIDDVKIEQDEWLYRSFLKLKRYHLRHKLFSGNWSEVVTREMVARPRVAAVLPYDPVLDKVVLIEQFRPGALRDPHGPWLLEVVAGVADGEESFEDLAQRELREEAGLTALELSLIARYWVSPGMCDEEVMLYCARVDASNAGGIHGLAHEHEDIKVHVMSTAEAFAALATGRVNNAMSIIALQWLQLQSVSASLRQFF